MSDNGRPADRKRDAIVVGGGPAGLACAIRAARYGLDVTLSSDPAGLWSYWAGKVHTHFGFPDGISGRALLERARAQAESLGVEILEAEALSAEARGDNAFQVQMQTRGDGPEAVNARFLVLADALRDVPEDIAIALARARIPATAAFVSDEIDLLGKRIVVFVDGPGGLRTALELAAFAEAVTAVVPPGACDEIMRDRLDAAGVAVTEDEVAEFGGDDGGLTNVAFANAGRIECDAGFVALEPSVVTTLARNLGLETNDGRIKADERCRTSVAGCYRVGGTSHWRALTEAEAEGARAALDIWRRTRRLRLG